MQNCKRDEASIFIQTRAKNFFSGVMHSAKQHSIVSELLQLEMGISEYRIQKEPNPKAGYPKSKLKYKPDNWNRF